MDAIDAAIRDAGSAGLVFLGSRLASGRPTGTKSLPDGPIDWRDLLTLRRLRGEYCAMARTAALLQHPYNESPGRDNTHVTWLAIARSSGLVVFDRPALIYDDSGEDRLSGRGRSREDPLEAAWCHRQLLDLYGSELRVLDPLAWADHVAKESFFEVLGGRRGRAGRALGRALSVSPQRSVAVAAVALVAGRRITRWAYRG